MLHPMTQAYLEAVDFTGTGPDDRAYNGRFEFAPETRNQAEEDCLAFLEAHKQDIGERYVQAGHDFWLTRNHHGAGFWDGDWPKEIGARLTEAAHKWGEVDSYIGDDHLIYFQ